MTSLALTWDGAAFWPLAAHLPFARRRYGAGEIVTMAEVKTRSTPSHRHYFASLREAWINLPEGYAERFPTDEHLRKWALIRTGYCHARSVVCRTRGEALRIAAFVRAIDAYALVSVEAAVIWHVTAMSQSEGAMSPETFQASKRAVLDLLAEILSVPPADLMTAGALSAA